MRIRYLAVINDGKQNEKSRMKYYYVGKPSSSLLYSLEMAAQSITCYSYTVPTRLKNENPYVRKYCLTI